MRKEGLHAVGKKSKVVEVFDLMSYYSYEIVWILCKLSVVMLVSLWRAAAQAETVGRIKVSVLKCHAFGDK